MTDLATERPVVVADDGAGPTAAAGAGAALTDPAALHAGGLHPVGAPTGPREIYRHRYLLRMLVRKELTVRYSRTTLGYAWSYVKPAVQLAIYFVIIGLLLGLDRRVENFPVYIFAGHTIVQFLTETWNAGTRSIRRNKALIKKVYLPRELFPVASMLVSLTHMGPPLVLLLVAATATGWEPSMLGVLAFVLALVLIGILGLALGMLFGALNVFVADAQNVVDILGMFMRWTAPMLYPWTLVAARFEDGGFPSWMLTVYLWNPICVAVELFHEAFWLSTVEDFQLSPDLFLRAAVMIAASCVFLTVAYRVFNRLQVRFAEEL